MRVRGICCYYPQQIWHMIRSFGSINPLTSSATLTGMLILTNHGGTYVL